jgi:hypothetical protein
MFAAIAPRFNENARHATYQYVPILLAVLASTKLFGWSRGEIIDSADVVLTRA